MNRADVWQASLVAISLCLLSPTDALAGKHRGVFRNCTDSKMVVKVDGKTVVVMRPGRTYVRSLKYGRRKVRVKRWKDGKVFVKGMLPVKAAGWFVQVGCGRKPPREVARLKRMARLGPFEGRFRNCSKGTILVYLDGKKVAELPSGKQVRRKYSGRHTIIFKLKKSKRTVFKRRFRFRPGWDVWWSCGKKRRRRARRRRHRCPRGYYRVKKGFCCPNGTVYYGMRKCIKKKRRKKR